MVGPFKNTSRHVITVLRPQTVRWISNSTAIAAVLFALLHGLIAPLLLFLAGLYLVATFTLFTLEQKVDRVGVIGTSVCLAALIGFYFAPIWIAERSAQTAEDHLKLAVRFAHRGQLLGNATKAQTHYRLAAEGGNAEAQARLGEALCFGHYGTVNRVQGIKWLKAAAANGDRRVQYLLESLEAH
jgi:TPR repeat protein